MEDVVHDTVYFSGRVQGVGFRFLASQVAREFEVAGIVSNLADGRVHLEAEGSAAQVNGFVAAIEERMHGYIRKTERTSEKRKPQFTGFSIR